MIQEMTPPPPPVPHPPGISDAGIALEPKRAIFFIIEMEQEMVLFIYLFQSGTPCTPISKTRSNVVFLVPQLAIMPLFCF